MAYIEPPGLSAAQKTDLWQRWSQGQSLREGGWPLGEHADSIHGVVSSKWGNHSGRPAAVTSGTDIGEREEISRGPAPGNSIRQIAFSLARVPPPSGEIARCGGATYRAIETDAQGLAHAHRPRLPALQHLVVSNLFWDPQRSWQRGTNENTNRLLRQYSRTAPTCHAIPRHDLKKIAVRLNCAHGRLWVPDTGAILSRLL